MVPEPDGGAGVYYECNTWRPPSAHAGRKSLSPKPSPTAVGPPPSLILKSKDLDAMVFDIRDGQAPVGAKGNV